VSPMLYVLIATFSAGALAFLISAISTNPRKRPIVAFGVAAVLSLLFGILIAYVALPEYTHWAKGGYSGLVWQIALFGLVVGVAFSGLFKAPERPYAEEEFSPTRSVGIAVALLVLLLVVRLIISASTPPHWWDTEGKRTLAAQLELTEGQGQAPDLDINKAIKVTPTHAKTKAQAAFPKDLNLGSYLELGDGYLQEVNGKPYYVFAFQVKDRRAFERRGSIIPGYIVVDATNKSGTAEWRPLAAGQEIRYVQGEQWWWSEKLLDRHVYFDYALPNNARIAELSGMELDDNNTPWYTATVMKPSVGYTAYEPKAFIIINPVTGQIQEYSLDEVPSWVDRILPDETAKQYVQWWGDWSVATPRWFGGSKGLQKKVDDTSLVWGPDGLMLQFVMKSKGNDTTATDVIYVNLRTGVATRYGIDSATQSTVAKIVEQKALEEYKIPMEARNCQVEFLAGKSVWYCLLEKEGNSWGVGIVQPQYAKAADASKVIVAEDLTDAYSELLSQIAEDASASGEVVDNSSSTVQFDGVIDRVGNVYFENGQWYLPFSLRISDGSVLFLRITTEKQSSHFIRDGDSVTVTAIKVLTGTPDTVIEVRNHTYPQGGS